ncbi:MAG: sulfurtransferase [Desulfosudaceae bacterium]
MKQNSFRRHFVIAVVLFLGVLWSFGAASQAGDGYPNDDFITSAEWLRDHLNDDGLVVVDVRTDKHFDDSVIPGAVRLIWDDFQYNDPGTDLSSVFVGVKQAQEILGRHGITRDDTVVLYDSVARDGGATASYVFWVLDVLGHDNKMILNRGIDAWKEAGFELEPEPRQPEELLYQAPSGEIRTELLINSDFVYKRLGDLYYQIVDVRSHDEYVGEKGTTGLNGEPLKLGHIPTAVNINYVDAWADDETKAIKSYDELRDLYAGLDSSKGVIVYCNSGRRSSFAYYILRLMGFSNVFTYEASWKEWGHPDKFLPVETRENKLTGGERPEPSSKTSSISRGAQTRQSGKPSSGEPAGGYVSCGG